MYIVVQSVLPAGPLILVDALLCLDGRSFLFLNTGHKRTRSCSLLWSIQGWARDLGLRDHTLFWGVMEGGQ